MLSEKRFNKAFVQRLDPGVGAGLVGCHEATESDEISLEYRHATAYLHGTVGVVDGALALSGRVVLDREVGEELGDKRSGREKVIPIAGIGGTVSRPRVKLDATALAAEAEAYTSQGKVREKLEETLGKEGADALEDILQGILGGRKKSR